jgi:hypothetical protein
VPPAALNSICVRASVLINETDPVVDGFMRVTLLIETVVRSPTIADDFRAWFDPSTNNVSQSFGGSIHNGHEKRSPSVAFHSTEYPLALNTMSAMIFPFTELALINLNGLIKTADLLRAVVKVNEHSLSNKVPPISYGSGTEAIFMLDKNGRHAVNDVVR